ncbi:MAG: 5' nucleotidase, NT5C type [Candidatus Nitrosocaldus sp.]
MMRIAVDVDGVLADIISVWLNYYNERNRSSLSKEQIQRWDFWKSIGYSAERFYAELATCWKEWLRVPVIENDIANSIAVLRRLGRVDIVSAQMAKDYVKRWLEYNKIVYDDYVSVARGADKADLEYDAFIDDSPLNAERISSMGKFVLLYDQPWNRHLSDGRYMVRVKSIDDARKTLIDRLMGMRRL